ncbi:SRPBCC family protein [Nocardia rhamnosiphila]
MPVDQEFLLGTGSGSLRFTTSGVVNAPVHQVWAIVGGFGGVMRWHPGIERCADGALRPPRRIPRDRHVVRTRRAGRGWTACAPWTLREDPSALN